METFDLLRICALWMRAIMSPSGSIKAIARSSLPARLDEARDEAAGTEFAQRNPAHLELAVKAPRPAGDFAAVADPRPRRVARQFGKLEGGGEALLHGLALVARDRPKLRAPLRKSYLQASPPIVLLNRTLLRHQGLLAFRV